ncbi:MAG: PorV/PorQ family protein [Bacteroidota bacterium]
MKKSFFIILIAGSAAAQETGTGLSFLKLGVGARSIAMGEAYTAMASDHSSLFYNPASLRFAKEHELQLMHKEWIAETSSEYLGASVLGENFSYGFSALNTSVGEIEVRTKPGPPEGTFSAQNFALGMTLSFSIDERLAVGLTGKFLYEKIFVDEASGYGFDIGGSYRYSDDLMFGASILNIGSMNVLRSQATELPTTIRAGAAYNYSGIEQISLIGAADVVKTLNDKQTHFNAGVEAMYDRLFAIRAGYRTGYSNTSLTSGFGVRYGIVKFDYAFVPFTEGFTSTHTFSFSFLL